MTFTGEWTEAGLVLSTGGKEVAIFSWGDVRWLRAAASEVPGQWSLEVFDTAEQVRRLLVAALPTDNPRAA